MNSTMELAAAVAAEYYAEDAETVIVDLWRWQGPTLVSYPQQVTLPAYAVIPGRLSVKAANRMGRTVEFDLKLHAATNDTCVYNVCRSGGWPEVTA